MDIDQIQAALAGLPLGGIRWLDKIGSTNDEAALWAAAGGPDFALVIAGEQTAGRGRSGRTWLSPPESSLSFSLILHTARFGSDINPQLNALGALAVVKVLHKTYNLPAKIKWPNDVLIHRQKVSGVLVDASWIGEHLQMVVLGIGINVASNPAMAAALDQSLLPFPPASLQDFINRPIDRLEILRLVLQELVAWLPKLSSTAFLRAWEDNLDFLGECVHVDLSPPSQTPTQAAQITCSQEGTLLGIFPDGSLRLLTPAGNVIRVAAGEVHLRPSKAPSYTRLRVDDNQYELNCEKQVAAASAANPAQSS